jgi:hypothetical protein
MSRAVSGSIVSRLAPAALDRYLAAALAMSRFPTAPFARRYPRSFIFYVAPPGRPIPLS